METIRRFLRRSLKPSELTQRSAASWSRKLFHRPTRSSKALCGRNARIRNCGIWLHGWSIKCRD